jgi:fibronectin type 3 domain-containing protein
MKIAFRSSVLALLISSYAIGQPPGVPQHLQAQYNAGSRSVLLSWDDAESVAGYNIFIKKYGHEQFTLWGKAGIVYQNNYEYEISSDYGQTLEFAVTSVQNYPEVKRSALSKSVAVEIPSLRLPMVKMNRPKKVQQSIVMSWQYDQSIADVRGFVMMINNQPRHFDKSIHECNLDNLPPGIYSIHVIAQSRNGVMSPPSPRQVVHVK